MNFFPPLSCFKNEHFMGIPWQSSGQDLALSLPGPGFNPWSENQDPASHVVQPKKRKKRPKNEQIKNSNKKTLYMSLWHYGRNKAQKTPKFLCFLFFSLFLVEVQLIYNVVCFLKIVSVSFVLKYVTTPYNMTKSKKPGFHKIQQYVGIFVVKM